MTDRTLHTQTTPNLQRRKVLQGVAAAVVAGTVPAVSAGILPGSGNAANLSGKLVCNISNPVKTLVLHNHSDKSMVLDHLSKSALMFDGSIVDCNNAFLDRPISIAANRSVEVQFTKLHARAIVHKVEDYQRIQSRVTRLSDGTRVIPFTATASGSGATFV